MVRNATYCGGFNRSTSLASICREKRALFFLPDLILTQRRSSLATKLHNGEVNRCRDGDMAVRHARAEWPVQLSAPDGLSNDPALRHK
jgi:hypothetical protein